MMMYTTNVFVRKQAVVIQHCKSSPTHGLWILDVNGIFNAQLNPCQSSVAFPIEISHLISKANQVTSFYVKCSIGWICVTWYHWPLILLRCFNNNNIDYCYERYIRLTWSNKSHKKLLQRYGPVSIHHKNH